MKYSSHKTYYNSEGEEVPSSTTVLKLLNKPFLSKWANIMGFKRKNIDAILEESSIIGTTVHNAIEAYLQKHLFIFIPPKQCGRELLMSYLNWFIEWEKQNEVEVEWMENSLTSKRFGGTIDFYGKVNGKHTILDIKTSKRFYPAMFFQLGSYVQLIEEQGLPVEQVMILIVNRDKYVERIMTRDEIEKYRVAFNQLVETFHLFYAVYSEDKWGALT